MHALAASLHALHVSTCRALRSHGSAGRIAAQGGPTRHAGAFAAALEMAEELVLRRKFFAAHCAPRGARLRHCQYSSVDATFAVR